MTDLATNCEDLNVLNVSEIEIKKKRIDKASFEADCIAENIALTNNKFRRGFVAQMKKKYGSYSYFLCKTFIEKGTIISLPKPKYIKTGIKPPGRNRKMDDPTIRDLCNNFAQLHAYTFRTFTSDEMSDDICSLSPDNGLCRTTAGKMLRYEFHTSLVEIKFVKEIPGVFPLPPLSNKSDRRVNHLMITHHTFLPGDFIKDINSFRVYITIWEGIRIPTHAIWYITNWNKGDDGFACIKKCKYYPVVVRQITTCKCDSCRSKHVDEQQLFTNDRETEQSESAQLNERQLTASRTIQKFIVSSAYKTKRFNRVNRHIMEGAIALHDSQKLLKHFKKVRKQRNEERNGRNNRPANLHYVSKWDYKSDESSYMESSSEDDVPIVTKRGGAGHLNLCVAVNVDNSSSGSESSDVYAPVFSDSDDDGGYANVMRWSRGKRAREEKGVVPVQPFKKDITSRYEADDEEDDVEVGRSLEDGGWRAMDVSRNVQDRSERVCPENRYDRAFIVPDSVIVLNGDRDAGEVMFGVDDGVKQFGGVVDSDDAFSDKSASDNEWEHKEVVVAKCRTIECENSENEEEWL